VASEVSVRGCLIAIRCSLFGVGLGLIGIGRGLIGIGRGLIGIGRGLIGIRSPPPASRSARALETAFASPPSAADGSDLTAPQNLALRSPLRNGSRVN
jgi:hypothetical protein